MRHTDQKEYKRSVGNAEHQDAEEWTEIPTAVTDTSDLQVRRPIPVSVADRPGYIRPTEAVVHAWKAAQRASQNGTP